MVKLLTKHIRRIKRYLKRHHKVLVLGLPVLILGISTYTIYMQNKRLVADPTSYKPLLHLIAKVESKNNYNAYFGDPANTTLRLTDMSIAEVMAWQQDFLQQGSPSDAVGRYQIISPTLTSLVETLGIDTSKKFDAEMQDALAAALLERRGLNEYVNNDLSHKDFAASLAKEWAALPKMTGTNPENSYYAGDGLNRALVSSKEVTAAITKIRAR